MKSLTLKHVFLLSYSTDYHLPIMEPLGSIHTLAITVTVNFTLNDRSAILRID